MPAITTHEVLVYHDETQFHDKKYKGHVLLFIPTTIHGVSDTPLFGPESFQYHPQDSLFASIEQSRSEYRLHSKLHFTEISGKRWTRFDLGLRIILCKVVDALRSKSSFFFERPLCCKLAVIFYPSNADYSMYGGQRAVEQELRHSETLLRILLKGAAHFLYSDLDRVLIKAIISDGQPHYRPFQEERVIWRLTTDEVQGRTPLRDYVSFSKSAQIIHVQSNHKLHAPSSPEHVQANLLQVADLLLGSTIRCCDIGSGNWPTIPRTDSSTGPKKDIVAYPVKEMLDKTNRKGGFLNSGHYRSFTVTNVEFSQGDIHFYPARPIPLPASTPNAMQPTLPRF